MGYAVGGDDNKTSKRSLKDAVEHGGSQTELKKDEMNGGSPKSREYLRMGEGNILEAHGRDVSNGPADVDGWGGPDAPYRGMATDAPYGSGAGMKGAGTSKNRRD